jgi:hypothetical protein
MVDWSIGTIGTIGLLVWRCSLGSRRRLFVAAKVGGFVVKRVMGMSPLQTYGGGNIHMKQPLPD